MSTKAVLGDRTRSPWSLVLALLAMTAGSALDAVTTMRFGATFELNPLASWLLLRGGAPLLLAGKAVTLALILALMLAIWHAAARTGMKRSTVLLVLWLFIGLQLAVDLSNGILLLRLGQLHW